MRSTFKVLFYLKKNAPKKNGFTPVMCRITVDGTICQFYSKVDIDPALWDMRSNRVSGRSTVALEANRHLDKVRVGINNKYKEIAERDNYVTAEKVKNAFLGLEMRHETLLKVYAQHNEDFAKQVGKMRSQSTYEKYLVVYNHLAEFIKIRYRVSDIALKELTPAFITDFELFLRTDKNCSHNTVWIYMMPLRRMVTIAQRNGWIILDPFASYEIGPENVDRGYLTKNEIRLLLDATFKRKGRELVRDLYVFCCFTGLSFSDMKNLTKENIQTSFDGNLWIMTRRQKTGVESNIMLLDIPKRIIDKYDGMSEDGKLLPVPSYTTCREAIKKIIKGCGIDKDLSWHASRHTMATEICLTNGMPIETLSKMLGHTNIRTTQIYAKITHEKESKDMAALAERLQGIEQFSLQTI